MHKRPDELLGAVNISDTEQPQSYRINQSKLRFAICYSVAFDQEFLADAEKERLPYRFGDRKKERTIAELDNPYGVRYKAMPLAASAFFQLLRSYYIDMVPDFYTPEEGADEEEGPRTGLEGRKANLNRKYSGDFAAFARGFSFKALNMQIDRNREADRLYTSMFDELKGSTLYYRLKAAAGFPAIPVKDSNDKEMRIKGKKLCFANYCRMVDRRADPTSIEWLRDGPYTGKDGLSPDDEQYEIEGMIRIFDLAKHLRIEEKGGKIHFDLKALTDSEGNQIGVSDWDIIDLVVICRTPIRGTHMYGVKEFDSRDGPFHIGIPVKFRLITLPRESPQMKGYRDLISPGSIVVFDDVYGEAKTAWRSALGEGHHYYERGSDISDPSILRYRDLYTLEQAMVTEYYNLKKKEKKTVSAGKKKEEGRESK